MAYDCGSLKDACCPSATLKPVSVYVVSVPKLPWLSCVSGMGVIMSSANAVADKASTITTAVSTEIIFFSFM